MSYLDQIQVGSTTYDIRDSGAQRETIFGSGAPTSSTLGTVGLHYMDTSATAPPYEYVCINVSSGTYTWEPIGAKGDTGDSGVYYGTGTPTDPDIKVWIDPSGSPINASIGTVETLEPGEDATASLVNTNNGPVFSFGIPKGAKGDTGATGQQGPKGDTGDTGPQGPAGADYVLTSQDKADIADIVISELPTWTGGSY